MSDSGEGDHPPPRKKKILKEGAGGGGGVGHFSENRGRHFFPCPWAAKLLATALGTSSPSSTQWSIPELVRDGTCTS